MRFLRLVLVVTLLLIAAPVVRPGAAAAAPDGDAVKRFGACLTARRAGDLLLLIDQSGSLKTSDPDGVRATASRYLLQQLTSVTQSGKITVNVAIAGFDTGYQQVHDWTELNPSTLPGLQRSVEDFRHRNTGVDTDYVNAIGGAQADLRSRAVNGDRCQAMLWFTDGQFDLSVRRSSAQRKQYGTTKTYAPGTELTSAKGVAQAVDAGKTALCRDGGIADQLRASGTVTIAEGLGPAGSKDFAFLRAVATGSDPSGLRCGRPPASPVGEFGLATNIDDLFLAFDAVADPTQAPVLTEHDICPRAPCAQGSHTFVLDRSVRAVHILADTGTDGVQLVLRAPDGTAATFLRTGTAAATLASGQLEGQWLSTRMLDLTLTRKADAGWSGQWSATFVDPNGSGGGTRARTQVRITGDLLPDVPDIDRLQFRTGTSMPVTFGLRSESGGAPVAAADLPGTLALSAQLQMPNGQVRDVAANVAKDQFERSYSLDLHGAPVGTATLRMTLSLQTAGAAGVAGTRLADRVVDLPVSILPPLNYPHVATKLDFGRREGTGPFTAALKVTGPGCVWIEPGRISAAPDGVGAVVVDATSARSADTCLHVEQDHQAELPVRLTVQHPGNGTVAGTIPVHLAARAAPDNSVVASVPVLADLSKPAVGSIRLSVQVLALLAGVGVPIGFLYLMKYLTARIPGRQLLAGAVRADVRGDVLVRDGKPFAVTHDDLRYLPVASRGVRRLTAPGGGVTITAKVSPSPFATGSALVAAAHATVVTSGPDTSNGPGRQARLPLAVHNHWVAVIADEGADIEVHVFMAADAGARQYADISEQIRSDLPACVAKLRRPTSASGAGEPNPTAGTPSDDWFAESSGASRSSSAQDWWDR